MNVNRCIRDYEHVFDAVSGWCWRCGKTRADGRRIGRLTDRWPHTDLSAVVDVTEPRRGTDHA